MLEISEISTLKVRYITVMRSGKQSLKFNLQHPGFEHGPLPICSPLSYKVFFFVF